MDKMIKNVIARYRDDPDEKAPDQDQSWMDYMKSQAQGIPPSETAVNIFETGKGTESEFSQYNPYDYEDPSGKPKDPKGPPFENEIYPDTEYAIFDHPKVFKGQGELKDWYDVREQDYTTVEEDQNPAISITRKYASIQNVIARYVMDTIPLIVSESEFNGLFMVHKVAASFNEILNKDFHYLNDRKLDRAGAVAPVWTNKGNKEQIDKGYFTFSVSSPGSKTGPHTVFIQLLKEKGDEGKRPTSYTDHPIQLACTCPSFLYHGAQYYAVLDRYMYDPARRKDLVAPKSQGAYVVHKSEEYPMGRRYPGRGLNFRVCKHLVKVHEFLDKMKVEVVYREYPVTGPPSKIMNMSEWKRLMQFDFTEANIKQRLRGARPKIPVYFYNEKLTQSVIDWFDEVWMPRTEDQKVEVLKKLVEYPERIFFILLKEARLAIARGGRISDRLIAEGYDLMSRTVQPDNKQTPQQAEMPDVPEEEKEVGKGTGALAPPGGEMPAGQFIKGVEPAIKEKPEELAPTTLRKVLTPEEKRKQREEKRKEEQEQLRERGLSDRARGALRRFQEETVEPRKQKKRELGKRPFYEEE